MLNNIFFFQVYNSKKITRYTTAKIVYFISFDKINLFINDDLLYIIYDDDTSALNNDIVISIEKSQN
jgi:hypothetical protein